METSLSGHTSRNTTPLWSLGGFPLPMTASPDENPPVKIPQGPVYDAPAEETNTSVGTSNPAPPIKTDPKHYSVPLEKN